MWHLCRKRIADAVLMQVLRKLDIYILVMGQLIGIGYQKYLESITKSEEVDLISDLANDSS